MVAVHCRAIEPSRVLFKGANKPGRFPGKRAQVWSFFVRRRRGRRRKEKKVRRIGLRGNYYGGDFLKREKHALYGSSELCVRKVGAEKMRALSRFFKAASARSKREKIGVVIISAQANLALFFFLTTPAAMPAHEKRPDLRAFSRNSSGLIGTFK